MELKRHKVFISYYHKDDQDYMNYLSNPNKYYYYDYEKGEYRSPFENLSVRDGDIDDTYMTDEQIRRTIRDNFMDEANVLIVLCGRNTKYRKHVDWEIHTAMYDSENNPQMGIVVINLPSITNSQRVRASDDSEKGIISDGAYWHALHTREEFEKSFPYMPSRIIDNFVKNIPITVVDWSRIVSNPERLMVLIDNAYKRRKSIIYDHSTPLRRRNS